MRLLFVRHGESTNNHKALQLASGDTELSESQDRLPDPSLTPAGVEGGSYCAEWIQAQIDKWGDCDVKIICSPMHRALESAWHLHEVLQVPVWVDPSVSETGGLFEGTRQEYDAVNEGDYKIVTSSATKGASRWIEGMSAADIQERFGSSYNVSMLPKEGGWWNRPPESARDCRKRARLLHKRLIACSASAVPEGANLKADHGWWSADVWESAKERILVFVTHGLFFDQVMRSLMGIDQSGGGQKHSVEETLAGDGAGGIPICFMLDNWATTVLEYRYTENNDAVSVCLQCHNVSTYLPVNLRRQQRMRNKFRSIIK